MDTGWLCGDFVVEQRWHFIVEHIRSDADVLTRLGLRLKRWPSTEKSTRYHVHGTKQETMKPLTFLFQLIFTYIFTRTLRTGQRKAINCSCCVSKKFTMKTHHQTQTHLLPMYQTIPFSSMENRHQRQQYLTSQLLCTPIRICRIKVMRPQNHRTHWRPH